MPYYRRVGEVPAKRHTQFRAPDGRLYAEDLMGTEGFSSSSALLYHRNPPTALLGAAAVAAPDDDLRPNEPLLPRHLRTAELPPDVDLVTARWSEYGIPTDPSAHDGSMRHSSRRLSRR